MLSRCPCFTQVSCLNLPHFLPDSTSGVDVSYRKDSSLHVKQLDLSKVQPSDASVLDSGRAAAYSTGIPTARPLPAVPVSASLKHSTKSSRAEVQLGTSSSAERHVMLSAEHGHVNTSAVQPKRAPFPAVPSPQQTSRLPQQPSSWQLGSAAGTAHNAVCPNSNTLAAKSWQQQLTIASAHEQWVAHKHTPRGRTSDPGNAEGWGDLLVLVPKQAGDITEELMQQLPPALAGSMHTQTALQVWQKPPSIV